MLITLALIAGFGLLAHRELTSGRHCAAGVCGLIAAAFVLHAVYLAFAAIASPLGFVFAHLALVVLTLIAVIAAGAVIARGLTAQ